MTNSSAKSRESSPNCIGKIANNDLPSQSYVKTHLNPRTTRNDVTDRVATKLAARRKEIAGMTSSQRIVHFRNKYSIVKTKGCSTGK